MKLIFVLCAVGILAAAERFDWAVCPRGYMRDADAGDCVACPKGTFSTTVDASSCTSCPEGQTTPREGTNEDSHCHACEPGTGYSEHRRSCLTCEEGYYGENNKCKRCPEGYTTTGTAKSAEDCTVCEWGYGREGDSCVACPRGSYANSDTPTCTPCPAGSTTIITGSGQCNCLPGYRFSLVDGALGCIPCPIGTYRGLDDDMFKCIDCYPGNTTEMVASPSEDSCYVP